MLYVNMREKNGYRKVPFNGKVLFMGDSITDQGMFISWIQCYLQLHFPERPLEIRNLGLSSETASGLSEPEHPFPRPCAKERFERALLTTEPNWLVLMYGMNDGIYYPNNEERMAAYQKGLMELIDLAHLYQIRVCVMTPTPFEPEQAAGTAYRETGDFSYQTPYYRYDETLQAYSEWILNEVAPKVEAVVDMHGALQGHQVTEDGIHPTTHGHALMAQAFLKVMGGITLTRLEEDMTTEYFEMMYQVDQMMHHFYLEAVGHSHPNHYEIDTVEHTMMKQFGLQTRITNYISDHVTELTEHVTQWEGHTCNHFYCKGYEALLVEAEDQDDGRWIWRMEFFGAFPQADLALLEKGYSIGYLRISDQYGCPDAIQAMESFFYHVTQRFQFRPVCVPFGFSRGGLYAMLLADKHSSWIQAMYLDAPVVDLTSWPGENYPMEYEEALSCWGYTKDTVKNYQKVLEERILTMTLSEIPLVLVYGNADQVVPYEANGRLLEEAYQESEARSLFIGKPGCDHHPHSLEDPTPIVEFIVSTEEE